MIKLKKCLNNILFMVMLSTITLGSTLAQQPLNSSMVTSDELRFVIFSINSADATLIIFPTGKTMMVDSGTENMNIARVMPFLQRHGIDHLDYYVDTHGHKDHYGGRAPMTAAGIIDENTKAWNNAPEGVPAKHAQVYYNRTDEGPKELFYESQFDMEGTHWFISNREDVEFFNSGNANINSLAFRMEYNDFIYSHGGDEARLSMNRYLADHPDLVEVHVRNTEHHMRGPTNRDYLEATNADLYVISNIAGMSSNKTYYNLLLDVIDDLQGNGKEHEAIITGDVGHVIIRVSGEDDWSYETCLDYDNCFFDYINTNTNNPLPMPGAASLISPSGVEVSIDTDLLWTAGSDATSHQVLFGTDAGNLASSSQSGTSFTPGTLLNNTTYYWQINEVNSTGTTLGDLWSFTTGDLLPPGVATINSPADVSTDVSLDTDLTWVAGTGTVSHEVLFGTDPENLVSNRQSGTSFDPGALLNNTTYYWQINEINAAGTSNGPLWSFTTQDDVLNSDAVFVSQSVPASMTPGQTVAVYVTMRNTGSNTWSYDGKFKLGSQNAQGNMTWGDSRMWMDSTASVPPNGEYTFTADVTAPSIEGTYNFQWKIVQEGVAWFGAQSTNVAVIVEEPMPLPGVASIISPANAGTDVSIDTMLTWAAGADASSHQVLFGTDPGSLVSTSQSGTSFEPGTLANNTTYYWQINEVNVTGTTTGALWSFTTIESLPGVASLNSPADASGDASIDTTLSWTAGSGAASHEVLFGTDTINLASTTQNGTSFNPGTLLYGTTYYWQINEINSAGSSNGSLWSFTTETLALTNAATFVSQNMPTSMTPGQTVSVSVTVNNAGTAPWTSVDGYKLGSQNAQDNTTWATNRVALTSDVAPGANHTFTFDVTAPATAGSYDFQWRMVQDGVQWFGNNTANVSVDVSSPEPVDTILSQSYFETDMDGWIDGDGSGGLVKRQLESSRAAQGDYSIKIKDNEGESSAMTSPSYDISSYDQITIDYQYYPHDQLSGDGYFVQYYDGSTWQTIATYAEGTDFVNGQFYSQSDTLDSSSYSFPTDAKFRMVSNGGGGGRHIYIDAVIITATTGRGAQ